MTKSLAQILEIIDGGADPSVIMEHLEEILEFSKEVDEIASTIMSSKSNEYAMGMLAIIQSLAMTVMMSKGMSPMQAIMMANDHEMSMYAALIMKLTVGISAMEELR